MRGHNTQCFCKRIVVITGNGLTLGKYRQLESVKLSLGKPYYESNGIAIYNGDTLELSSKLPANVIDALITDPPYCSGAAGSAVGADPTDKYCHNSNTLGRPSFGGDFRDQRSFKYWCSLWIGQALRACKDAAYGLVFTDWRQLATVIDALQAGGFCYKGLISWDKGGGARAPHKGYFRHQCEYIPWGSKGKVPKLKDRGPFPGSYSIGVKQVDKHHMTGKPTPLMQRLVQCVPAGGLAFDPFCGSGTTLVASVLEGRGAIGFEASEEYCEIAARRIEAAQRGELLRFQRE
ncbi:DNA-methyltransferase [Gimesia algae]|uniref:Methyltransferase n=1 Tax=Gimesia algae TaxID=2527971 RepID=A0A517VMA3_9PLAN|nr:DNA methyltransferase [Gimesia algae]QDT94153.1 Modification methylase DpnIIB [Gimesia algae]